MVHFLAACVAGLTLSHIARSISLEDVDRAMPTLLRAKIICGHVESARERAKVIEESIPALKQQRAEAAEHPDKVRSVRQSGRLDIEIEMKAAELRRQQIITETLENELRKPWHRSAKR